MLPPAAVEAGALAGVPDDAELEDVDAASTLVGYDMYEKQQRFAEKMFDPDTKDVLDEYMKDPVHAVGGRISDWVQDFEVFAELCDYLVAFGFHGVASPRQEKVFTQRNDNDPEYKRWTIHPELMLCRGAFEGRIEVLTP